MVPPTADQAIDDAGQVIWAGQCDDARLIAFYGADRELGGFFPPADLQHPALFALVKYLLRLRLPAPLVFVPKFRSVFMAASVVYTKIRNFFIVLPASDGTG